MRCVLLLALLLCLSLPSLAQDNSPTPYEIALQRIEEEEASGATELDLHGLGLTELPPEIGNLTRLEILALGNNELISLPPQIGNLNNLRVLYLHDNELSELPPEIGNLTNLWLLLLKHNQLTSIPPEISDLSKLCVLDLYNNQLQYLPYELSQIERLYGDDCRIIVGENPLISPPQEVIVQGTPAILDYLENEAWWHLQRLIVGAASSLGLVAAVVLGLRWRQRGKQKRKHV
jgi:internalin A